MGLLWLLVIVVGIGVPVSVVALLVGHARLRSRVAALERQVAQLGAAPEARPAHGKKRRPEAPPVTEAPPEPEAPPPAEAEPEPEPKPEPEPATPEPRPAAAEAPPAAFVFRVEKARGFERWLKENWFLAIAALSLALAGIFLVQYGIEQGLLTPSMRVIGAVVLGAALIAAAEWLRRRAAAGTDMPEVLPQAFGGAGIVSIFAGILAARQLYGLIGVEPAFAGLALTGAAAVLLGWFYGPFLSGIGILGAVATPFLVGGASTDPFYLYGYFALVVAVGLAVDAARRWAWLSAFVLIFGMGAATMLYLAQGGGLWFLAYALFAVAASAAIPVWSLAPDHGGATTFGALGSAGRGKATWPEFPTRLVAGTTLAAAWVAWDIMSGNPLEYHAALIGMGLLFAMLALWLCRAPALDDLAAIPLLTGLAILAAGAAQGLPGFRAFGDWVPPDPETLPPFDVSWITAGAALASIAAAWRALRPGPHPTWWTALAALTAPLTVIMLELFWHPAQVLGDYAWALHALAVAALMTVLAQRHAHVARHRELRISLLLVTALTMISLALILWFTYAALTAALAVMVLAAALLDRRFDLPPMEAFVATGTAVLTWRLLIDPGLGWATGAPLASVLFAHGAVIAALLAARAAVAQSRPRQAAMLETATTLAAALLASALLYRGLVDWAGFGEAGPLHGALQAVIWLLAAMLRLRRAPAAPGWAAAFDYTVAGLAMLAALALTVLIFTLEHPVWGFSPEPVRGPWLLNTLLIAYALPAALLLAAPRILPHQPRFARALRWLGAAGLAHWAALEIRHVWRGPDLSVPGVTDPEQYSYTIALMLLSAALMLAAWHRHSPALRRLGVIATALTIAKVFLVDMSGLAGLIRVASFLALGLALAGLAQVNRWMSHALNEDHGKDGDHKED